MDIGAYVLTIEDGREYLELTDQEGWSNIIQCGTTVVMNVIMTQMTQEVYERSVTRCKCPFCNCRDGLKGNDGKSSVTW